jgi:hypothetical protein
MGHIKKAVKKTVKQKFCLHLSRSYSGKTGHAKCLRCGKAMPRRR